MQKYSFSTYSILPCGYKHFEKKKKILFGITTFQGEFFADHLCWKMTLC